MSIKKLTIFLLSMLLTGFMTGCGTDPEEDLPTNSTKGIVGSSFYIINSATTYQDITEVGGIVMKATTAGGAESIAGFAVEKNGSRPLAAAAAGYVTTGELRESIALIETAGYLNNLSTINEQVFTKYTEYTVGDYSFATATAQRTVDVANQILNTLGATSVVLPAGTGVTATAFRMFMTVTSFNGHYYYTVSISPRAKVIFEENFALMTALSSGTNYTGANERLVSSTENSVGLPGTTNQADFLFVVDDSGSMGDQQTAIATAADDFEAALDLAGMNYNIAIITTSEGADGSPCIGLNYCYDRSVQNVGIIDNDINVFKSEINAIDTNGSPIETGIYNAEQALKQTANGDSYNGLLNTSPLSFPRANTQLSMVILSDEVSQYPSRAGTSFNTVNNLFTRDRILVNAIVDTGLCGASSFYGPGEDTNGQYDDLAIATGGLVGNICNGGVTPNFSAVMQNIVFQAAGKYRLGRSFAKPNSMEVTVDGVASIPSIKNGYMYIEGTNSIAFFGTLPAEGADVQVYYEFPKEINLFNND